MPIQLRSFAAEANEKREVKVTAVQLRERTEDKEKIIARILTRIEEVAP